MKNGCVRTMAVLVVAALTLATSAWVDAKEVWKRDGTVKDKSGKITEVRAIDVVEDDKRFLTLADEFGYLPWSLTIQTPTFQTFVPLESVITFERKAQDVCDITYIRSPEKKYYSHRSC